jgi:hypothetical protein
MRENWLRLLGICLLALYSATLVQAAGTTEVQVVKYATDGSVLEEVTVDYRWMEENLPVYGDGKTHYYLQGPVFEEAWEKAHPGEAYDPWNPQEDVNVLEKDLGAVKGTSLQDLCDLVGGISPGDEVVVKAADGFYKTIPYQNVYQPDPRQGLIIVSWYALESAEGQSSGYVLHDYQEGMRLVFLADCSTNPWEEHVFGIGDMRACFPEDLWHYYRYPDYPTTTGLSVKYVDQILVYSDQDPANR